MLKIVILFILLIFFWIEFGVLAKPPNNFSHEHFKMETPSMLMSNPGTFIHFQFVN